MKRFVLHYKDGKTSTTESARVAYLVHKTCGAHITMEKVDWINPVHFPLGGGVWMYYDAENGYICAWNAETQKEWKGLMKKRAFLNDYGFVMESSEKEYFSNSDSFKAVFKAIIHDLKADPYYV